LRIPDPSYSMELPGSSSHSAPSIFAAMMADLTESSWRPYPKWEPQ